MAFMALWMVPAVVALPMMAAGSSSVIVVLLCVVAALAFPCSLLVTFNTMTEPTVPNRPGLMVSGDAIIGACAQDGVREVAVTTPIVSLSNQEWYMYEMARNDVGGLWFQPTDREHVYTLYWRGEAHPEFEDALSMERVGYRRDSRHAMEFSRERIAEWIGKGVDMRMRPLLLHVRGEQAWVTFPAGAPLTDDGPKDANIRPGVDGTGVFMLADTF